MNAKWEVLKGSIENLHILAVDLLHMSKRGRSLPGKYKEMISDIATASVATLNHLHELENQYETEGETDEADVCANGEA